MPTTDEKPTTAENPKPRKPRKPRSNRPLNTVNGALMDLSSVAAYCGTTEWTVRRWAERGHLPFIRIGARIVIRRQALEAHLAKLEREAEKRCAKGNGA